MLVAPADASELAEALWQPDAEFAGSLWGCVGAYVEPPMPLGRDADSAAHPIVVTAPSATSLEGVRTEATGGVEVRQGNRLLTAEVVTLDESGSRATARGEPRFGEPGIYVQGQDATVDLAGGASSVSRAEFVITDGGVRGSAARMERRGDVMDLEAATLTRCPPGNATWEVRARTVRIDQEFATARGARFVVGRVPVFYAPYLRFPVSGRRASGFLFPSVGYDGDDGIDLSLPYYLNLAPNYDATLAPRLIGERGVGFEAEFRHLSRRFETTLGGAFLATDRRYDGELARSDSTVPGAEFSPADRWSVHVDHTGGVGRLRTRVDYAAVSDNDYFADIASDYGALRTVSLERRAELRYTRGGLFARLLAQGFQRLEPGRQPYRRLPEAKVSYAGFMPGLGPGPLSWSLGASWTSFQAADDPGGAAIAGERLHVEPRLRLALARPWGFFNLAAGARHTGYDVANTGEGVDHRPRRGIGLGIVDAGVFLERPVFGTKGREQWVQTLEPRLYFLRQSYADQADLPSFDATRLTFSYSQLFRDNRFAGLDRIGDANRISLGLATRLLNARGAEVVSARIGGIAYQERRRVTLSDATPPTVPVADVVGELRGTFGAMSILSKLAWDSGDGEFAEVGIGLSYRKDARRILNVGYRRRSPEVDQTDVSVYWPLPGASSQWSAFARWNHDWRSGLTIEGFAGLAYANCCLEVKMLWQQRIDLPRNLAQADSRTDRGIAIQIAFRGFAGFGRGVDSRLVRGIKGYRPGDR